MGKTQVIYRDIAVGAAEDADVSVSGQTPESDHNLLLTGVHPGKIITFERNRWTLDGAYTQYYGQSTVAFWSEALSDEGGSFDKAPVITVSFDQQYSSTGITLIFDLDTGEYCSLVNIKWYQGETLKCDQDFEPDSAEYFCTRRVESYDKLVISLKKTSLPVRRAKLNHIIFGVTRVFGRNNLRNASLTNQMSEISVELPVSTFQWTLDSKEDVDYLFQLKQPVEVQNNGNTLGVYYITGSSRKNERIYKIDCQDALGVLDGTPFAGGAYLSGVSAKTLLSQLASPFEVDFEVDVEDLQLTGILEPGTARSAIQQVVFAWGVCLATDGGEKLRVFNLPDTAAVIPKSRTYQGASTTTTPVVTRVDVTAHSYSADNNGSIDIGGTKYSDTKTVYSVSNPNLVATDKENVKTIEQATLVSPEIGETVAQRTYNYYSKRETIAAKIVYEREKLGDKLSVYTPWGQLLSGNLEKMEVTLSNTIAYKAEVKS